MVEQVTESLSRLLTEAQIADLLQVKRNTLAKRRCNRSGGPKWTYVGKDSIRYREVDVQEYITERLQECV